VQTENERLATHSCRWLWNLTRPRTVVNVKKSSIESRRMNREMQSHPMSAGSAYVDVRSTTEHIDVHVEVKSSSHGSLPLRSRFQIADSRLTT
jgi:hypothetical protein